MILFFPKGKSLILDFFFWDEYEKQHRSGLTRTTRTRKYMNIEKGNRKYIINVNRKRK